MRNKKCRFVAFLLAASMALPLGAQSMESFGVTKVMDTEAQEILESLSEENAQDDTDFFDENEVIWDDENIEEDTSAWDEVDWDVLDPDVLEKKEMLLKLGDKVAILDNEVLTLDVAPTAIEGSTYVALRFIVENLLEAQTNWNTATNEVSVLKNGKEVVLSPNSKKVVINGTPEEMPAPVRVENGRTLVPLRFLSETFGIQVNYAEGTIVLVETHIMPAANTLPVARFEFVNSSYVAGQKPEIRDWSYDDDGDALVKRIWMINGDESKTATSLSTIFSKPVAGEYTVSMKVLDAKGGWSEWVHQSITILPNQAPVIEVFETKQKSYACGEKIEFELAYTNEEWEQITDAKWTYRGETDPENKQVVTRPTAFYQPGNHIVTLQLTDEYGNLSEIKSVSVHVTDEVVKTEFESKFETVQVGEIIDNFDKINFRDFAEEQNVEVTQNTDMLVMSNSPEQVTALGVLYKQEIVGKGRILLHHFNALSETVNLADRKRVVVVAENNGEETITLKISNQSVKVPSTSELILGQKVLEDYFKGVAAKNYVLKPGDKVFIYDSKGTRWSTGEGISGLMDFETTGPLMIRVAAVNSDTTAEQVALLPVVDKDSHNRGTFGLTEKELKINLTSSEPTQIVLVKDRTEALIGIENITGEIAQNTGHYGVTYRITVTAQEDTGIILNGRGGLYSGAVKWLDENKTYCLPRSSYLPAYERAAVLGVVRAGQTRTFEYMLPNGSSAPVLIGFIPKSAWQLI
jgi:PKD repeat protein